jgi:hypothetical protein
LKNYSISNNIIVITIMKRIASFVAFWVIILYVVWGTGLHGDDYSVIGGWHDWADFLNADPLKKGLQIFGLPTYYSFWWAYFVMGFEHQWVYDLIKSVAYLASFLCTYKFARDYFPRDRAILASVLFVFYPLHETALYWYMTASYVLCPAVIMCAHSLMRNDRNRFGFLLLHLGAFAGYCSPPYVFGLAAIFLYECNYKKAVLFASPGALYVAFYFWIKVAYSVENRINSHLGIMDLLKQFMSQLLSFIEAAVGPSYWLKIYFSIASLSVVSAVIAASIIVYFVVKSNSFSERPEFQKSLFFGLFSVLYISFAIYALTGLYQHSAFNLGNRSNIYGSLLIAFMLALLPLNKKTVYFIALIFIIPLFGLSDYWKSWNVHQKRIIENIHTNASLKVLEPESTLLVAGNIYSKLGPFSHIEFFSMPWVVNSIFHDWVESKDVVALTPSIELNNGSLIDTKNGGRYPLESNVYVYDSDANTVTRIALSSVPQLLANRPREIRHWVQLAKGTWVESIITYMSPRLSYLFIK